MSEFILIKEGELTLKGLNRRNFEDCLIRNLKRKLKPCGDFDFRAAQSIVYIEPTSQLCDLSAATELARKTFGAAGVARARSCPKDARSIADCAIDYLRAELSAAASFKVESKRSDKRYPLTSIRLSQYVGGEIADAYPAIAVDVHNPELTVNVEIREDYAYVHASNNNAAGGLPVGSSGSAVALLSGGIDSPVAIWMMARRGLRIIPVHFHSPPYTSELAKQKVLDLAQILLPWCEKLTVELIPFTDIQEQIRQHCPEPLFTVISRRFMTRIAAQIAVRNGCGSLVTGENLGQVASQTQDSIAVTQQCVDLPILRPLIGMDKQEIVARARQLGTFDTSVLPYEDCCTVFTPRKPKTKPKLDDVLAAESRLDVESLVRSAILNSTR
ncbi:MAG: tRNA 4-thiouridine(8) synthase ThiI [Oscillospiraceae bacterium]|jgi:thiamine biosynthesis protein ThiI|nr:tRNA 4-thiouridine(8) synthase ThiI [Oscillospiraceae bacterium]